MRHGAGWRRAQGCAALRRAPRRCCAPAPLDRRGNSACSIAACSKVEAIQGVSPEVDKAIEAALDKCLTHTDLKRGVRRQVRGATIPSATRAVPGAPADGAWRPSWLCSLGECSRHGSPLPHPSAAAATAPLQGKVRDTYDLGDKVIIVTTDRQSAFDRLLASIPFKGQVRGGGLWVWLRPGRS
jgi:hypothetical protein